MGINKLPNLYHRNYIEYIWDFSLAHLPTTSVAFSSTFPRSWPDMGPSVIREAAWHDPFSTFLRRISNSFCISFDALQPPHPLASLLPLPFPPRRLSGPATAKPFHRTVGTVNFPSSYYHVGLRQKCHLPRAGVSGPLLSPPGPLASAGPVPP